MISNDNLQNRIKHIFVVMLENRSFDHMLGFSNLLGMDAVSGQPEQASLTARLYMDEVRQKVEPPNAK